MLGRFLLGDTITENDLWLTTKSKWEGEETSVLPKEQKTEDRDRDNKDNKTEQQMFARPLAAQTN